VSIVPDTGAPATDATDTHAHQQQPATPAAEPHERAG